jgi:hypothetical protein
MSEQQQARRRYFAPVAIASPGLGPLRLVPTLLVFVVPTFALLVVLRAGLAGGVLVLLVGIALAAPLVVQRNGRPLYVAVSNGARRRWAVRTGHTTYRSGLFGVTHDGSQRLPGLLAALECWSVESDGLGRPFALVEIGSTRQWAVVLRVVPEAGALVDAEARDLRVAAWGDLLATAGRIGRGADLVAAVIEMLPDAGAMLQAHVEGLLSGQAPQFALDVLRASAAELPSGVSSTVGFLTVTFSERSLGIEHAAKRNDRAQAVTAEFGRLLPDLSAQLVQAGASTAVPLDAFALSRRLAEAFDPAQVLPNAQQAAAGNPPRIRWEDCGPRAADDNDRIYLHASGASVVYEATRMIRGAVHDRVLETLAGPMPAAPRKRVTLLYRPVPADLAALVVDRGVKTAINRAGRRKGPVHAHDAAALDAAERTADEEAAGAGVGDLSLIVTVTANVEAGEDVSVAAAAVKRASTNTFRLTRVDGGHAAAFAIGLGVGLSPWQLAIVPSSLRDHL